jgi:hypothetical protein
MRHTARITLFVALSLIVFAAVWSPASAQNASDLTGAWVVTGWTNADGTAVDPSQRGLFIFVVRENGGSNYSMMYVPGDEPRAQFQGEQATDDELLAAYGSFVANSGRLFIDGDKLSFDAYMAKNPNYMASFGENLQAARWKIEGEVLTLTFQEGFSEGRSVTLRHPG